MPEHHDTDFLLADIAPGERRLVDTPRGRFAIARPKSDAPTADRGSLFDDGASTNDSPVESRPGSDLVAFEAWCPHLDGPLWEGSISDGEVGCPWHGWRYSLTTGLCTWAPEGDMEEARETSLGRARCEEGPGGVLRLVFADGPG